MNITFPSSAKYFAAAFTLLALTACASFTPDGGLGLVEQTTKTRIGKEIKWARSDADRDAIHVRVRELLQKKLSIDDAVQIALLNNRGLQARIP